MALFCTAATQRPRSSAPQRRSGGLPMRQQRSSAERPARAPPPTKTHPEHQQRRPERKADAVWQRFKGQPHAAPEEPGKAEVLGVAEAIVRVGPSSATAAAMIRAEPAVLLVPPDRVAAKVESVGSVVKDAVKSRQALYRKLGEAAAHAAALDLDDGAFAASCQLLGELAAAARPAPRKLHHDRVWEVLQSCDTLRLTALLCDHSAAELRGLLAALGQHLGWGADQAAAALLGFAGSTQAPSACPHRRFKRLAAASPEGVAALGALLRSGGHEDAVIAKATLGAQVDWTAMAASASGVKAAVFACHKATGLPGTYAVLPWLAGFQEPPLLGMTRELVHAGAGPEQVQKLALLWLELAEQIDPEQLFNRLAVLMWQLGDWQAAVVHLLREGSL